MPQMPYDEYDEEGLGKLPDDWNESVYEDRATAEAVFDGMEVWRHGGEGGENWSQDQWFSMVHEIDNFHDYVDDDGTYHAEFDFSWESDDGKYFGSSHISY
jgi:hypothetical protein